MLSPVIDQTICIGCGACASVCPSSQILLDRGKTVRNGFPPRPCHGCGHCFAVCPARAIRIFDGETEIVQDGPDLKDWRIPENTLAPFLQMRRSVRFFKKDPVPRELLTRLMNMNRWAPTACNRQELGWIVLSSEEKRSRLAEAVAGWAVESENFRSVAIEYRNGRDTILRNAPCVVLVHAPDNDFGEQDCAIALECLELLLASAGLGSCWSGLTHHMAKQYPGRLDFLDIKPGRRVFGALMVGWPDVRFLRVPPRKPLDLVWN